MTGKLTWPHKHSMTPLDIDSAASPGFALGRMFAKTGPADSVSIGLWTHFIRVSDKAAVEYELARGALSAVAERSTDRSTVWFSGLLAAAGHFENLITTLHSAIRFANYARKNHPYFSTSGRSVFCSDTVERVMRFRNAIEHHYEDLAHGRIDPDHPNGLVPQEDCVRFGEHTLSYKQLRSWVTQLHELALSLISYREPPE